MAHGTSKNPPLLITWGYLISCIQIASHNDEQYKSSWLLFQWFHYNWSYLPSHSQVRWFTEKLLLASTHWTQGMSRLGRFKVWYHTIQAHSTPIKPHQAPVSQHSRARPCPRQLRSWTLMPPMSCSVLPDSLRREFKHLKRGQYRHIDGLNKTWRASNLNTLGGLRRRNFYSWDWVLPRWANAILDFRCVSPGKTMKPSLIQIASKEDLAISGDFHWYLQGW